MKKKSKELVVDVGINSFLRDLHKNHLTTKVHIDTKLNWLLGISGLISSIILPYILSSTESFNYFGLMIIAASGYIAFVVCIFSLDLPENLLGVREAKENNYMYPGYFKNSSVEEIKESLSKIKNYDSILEQYSINMYNLINRNIIPKKRALNIAKNTLLAGIITGTLVILIGIAL